jgi:SAM-dependent methyltransferase
VNSVQAVESSALDKLTPYIRRHREIWRMRPALRQIYHRWYRSILDECVPGRMLEIGAGCGNFKEFCPELICTDVTPAPWVDLCADGANLPFKNGVFDNIVGVDVLHHVFDPDKVLNEISRVVRPGGRAVFIEPYVSPWSRFVRGMFHHEKQDLSQDVIYGADKRPEDSNVAIPTRVFVINRAEFGVRFPRLSIRRVSLSDVMAYPMSRGFQKFGLLPDAALGLINRAEPILSPLAKLFAFKMLISLEVAGPAG